MIHRHKHQQYTQTQTHTGIKVHQRHKQPKKNTSIIELKLHWILACGIVCAKMRFMIKLWNNANAQTAIEQCIDCERYMYIAKSE